MIMETPNKIVVDCSTGQAVELPLTDEEIAQRDADIKAAAALAKAQAAEAKAKEAARNAVLEKLGLTAEEVNALLA